MFDRIALKITKPLVDATARQIVLRGFSADQVTLVCFALGMLAVVLIMFGQFYIALVPLLLGRICDGLDGAVARQTVQTDRGAFMDIALDFVFYASVPLSFAVAAPQPNALAAAFLLAAFVGTGTSFLAYATLAEKRGEKSTAYPSKSFYYLGGLTEGTETIATFTLMCLFPQHFALLAYIYALLCTLTTATRIFAGWQNFVATRK
jgi:phosphatidylglycerophosphate synthase